jgi:hypothetical protein
MLFPLQLYIGPNVLRLFFRRVTALAQTAVQPKFYGTVIREQKLKGLVSMIKSQSLRQGRLLMASRSNGLNHSSAMAPVRVNFLNNFGFSTRSISSL